jgi:integrating conjugative element protein (TIGR03752 family)
VQGNPLLKFLAIPFLILAVIIIVKVFSGNNENQAAAEGGGKPKISAGQAQALGVDGDTPSDTLRTIVAESRQLKDQVSQALTNNEELKRQNQELQTRLQNIDQNVAQRLNNAQQQLEQTSKEQNQGMLDMLQKQFDTLGRQGSGSDMPIGFGIQPGDGQGFQGAPGLDIIWIEPQDATPVDADGKPIAAGSSLVPSGFNFPTSFGQSLDQGQNVLNTSAQRIGGEIPPQDARQQVRKVYTLPQNSTLMGSVAMSALIGRVPVDGTVNDPYPFKILIGPDNLTANGIDLPDVAGAVASGTASGDWTLSCVRGQIRSLTFVFNDGTVRTFPAPAAEANGSQNSNQASSNGGQQTIQGGLGWISDPYGIPCIAGDRRSNAKEYLGNQSLLTAAGAGIAKLLDADENTPSTVFSGNSTAFGTTGTQGDSALGTILTGGVNDIRQWMNKLYGEAFAAVYVQPGAQVSVHLDQQLAIDYELKGRKVDYSSGATHVSANLD